MQVDDTKDAVAPVDLLDPVPHRAEVVAEMEVARRLNAGEDLDLLTGLARHSLILRAPGSVRNHCVGSLINYRVKRRRHWQRRTDWSVPKRERFRVGSLTEFMERLRF